MNSFIAYGIVWLVFVGAILWIFSLAVRGGHRADGDLS